MLAIKELPDSSLYQTGNDKSTPAMQIICFYINHTAKCLSQVGNITVPILVPK